MARKYAEPDESSFKAIFAKYKSKAKNKRLKFYLTEQEFRILVTSRCYLCNAPPSNRSKHRHGKKAFYYNGIDRLCNNVGYVKDNVFPCCPRCNSMKSSSTLEGFIRHLNSILIHINLVFATKIGEKKDD